MNRLFTYFIVSAMVLGIAVGWAVSQFASPDQARAVADNLSIITDVFLRLIKMIIAPLVFTTLVAGIAHMEDAGAIGRVGVKTIGWFIGASIVSLLLGLAMVHLLQPGSGLNLAIPDPGAAGATVDVGKFTLREFLTHLVPSSIVDAMARNEILQIVVFSVFVGTAVAAIDDRAPQVLAVVEQGAAIMLKVTGYVMKTAPLAIFAALAATIATQGIEVLGTYAQFIGGFYLSLGLLWALLIGVCVLIVGRRALALLGAVRSPALLAFSTASSEAAYPRTLEALQVEIEARSDRPFPQARISLSGDWAHPDAGTEAQLRAALAKARDRDAAAGRALVGPHRTDLVVIHAEKDRPAGECSTGEQKALILNLVLAQAARLSRAEADPNPILLLDEVAAHLDAHRRWALFDEITALGLQAFLTGADRALFEAIESRAQGIRVETSHLELVPPEPAA